MAAAAAGAADATGAVAAAAAAGWTGPAPVAWPVSDEDARYGSGSGCSGVTTLDRSASPPAASATGHGPLHLLRQVDVLDFDARHLDPPWVGALVDDLAHHLVSDKLLQSDLACCCRSWRTQIRARAFSIVAAP